MRATRLGVWPPLPPTVRRPDVPFPLEDPRCRLYARARHGLFHGVTALGLGPGDAVLVPAYHHGSEIEALVQAGLEPIYYGSDEQLRPRPEDLDARRTDRVRALHLVHVLGFPQDAPAWRSWCDERDLVLIEDAAQAFLATVGGRPLGSWGDLSVTCMYKTFGLPDGAGAVCRAPLPPARGAAPALGALARRGWAAVRNAHRAPLWVDGLHRRGPYDAARDFVVGDPAPGPSRATRWLLPRVVTAAAAERRRSNFRTLLDGHEALVPAPFRSLPEGAVPMAFPVAVPDKASLLDALDRIGITGLDLWSVPHPTCPPGFEVEADLRAHVVGLPVHQELRSHDLHRIADALDRSFVVSR